MERSKQMLNRQARVLGTESWHSFGPVSHCDAAKKMAIRFAKKLVGTQRFIHIETRCVDAPGAIQTHLVQQREEFVVMPQRGGE